MAQGLCTLPVGTILTPWYPVSTLVSLGHGGVTGVGGGCRWAAGNHWRPGLSDGGSGHGGVAIGLALQAPPLCSSPWSRWVCHQRLGKRPAVSQRCWSHHRRRGQAGSKETVDILADPIVTVLVGIGGLLIAPPIGAAASAVGNVIMWATELQPFFMGILGSVIVGVALTCPFPVPPSARPWPHRPGRRGSGGRVLRPDGGFCHPPSGRTAGAVWSPRAWDLHAQMGNTSAPRIWILRPLRHHGPIATCLFQLQMNGTAVSPAWAPASGGPHRGAAYRLRNDIAQGLRALMGDGLAGMILICFVLPGCSPGSSASLAARLDQGWGPKLETSLTAPEETDFMKVYPKKML